MEYLMSEQEISNEARANRNDLEFSVKHWCLVTIRVKYLHLVMYWHSFYFIFLYLQWKRTRLTAGIRAPNPRWANLKLSINISIQPLLGPKFPERLVLIIHPDTTWSPWSRKADWGWAATVPAAVLPPVRWGRSTEYQRLLGRSPLKSTITTVLGWFFVLNKYPYTCLLILLAGVFFVQAEHHIYEKPR